MGTRRTDLIERAVAYEAVLAGDYSAEFKDTTREWLEDFSTEQLRHYIDRLEMLHGDKLGIDWSASTPSSSDGGLTGNLNYEEET